MVVGRGNRHPTVGADVADGPGGDDRPLVGHEPRDAGGGAKRAGIGERDRGADEVVRPELVRARLRNELLVAGVELREVHRVGALDDGHHQEARPVGTLDIHGEAEVDGSRVDPVRALGDGREVVAHRALLGSPLHDRPADEVGEAHLARRDLRVELPSPRLEGRDVDLAERRRGRDFQAGGHVLGEARGGALDERRAFGNGGIRSRLAHLDRHSRGRCLRGHRLEPVAPGIEVRAPLVVDAGRIVAISVVEVEQVPRVDEVQARESTVLRGPVAGRGRWLGGGPGWLGRGHGTLKDTVPPDRTGWRCAGPRPDRDPRRRGGRAPA